MTHTLGSELNGYSENILKLICIFLIAGVCWAALAQSGMEVILMSKYLSRSWRGSIQPSQGNGEDTTRDFMKVDDLDGRLRSRYEKIAGEIKQRSKP